MQKIEISFPFSIEAIKTRLDKELKIDCTLHAHLRIRPLSKYGFPKYESCVIEARYYDVDMKPNMIKVISALESYDITKVEKNKRGKTKTNTYTEYFRGYGAKDDAERFMWKKLFEDINEHCKEIMHNLLVCSGCRKYILGHDDLAIYEYTNCDQDGCKKGYCNECIDLCMIDIFQGCDKDIIQDCEYICHGCMKSKKSQMC